MMTRYFLIQLVLTTKFLLVEINGLNEENPKTITLPKNWFAYTEHLLFSTTKLINKNCQYSNHPLVQLLHDVQTLVLTQYMDLQINVLTTTKTNFKFEYGIIKHLFGNIQYVEHGFNLPDKESSYSVCLFQSQPKFKGTEYSYLYVWKFNLHNKLRLKLIVSYLYIVLKNIMSCYSGYLQIRGFSLGIETLKLTYCGIHTYLEAYPPDRNVSIQLLLRPYVTSSLLINYNVIDPHQNVSYKISDYNDVDLSNFSMDYAIYNWHIKIHIIKFHIVESKWKVITLSFTRSNDNSFDVFDGPNPHFSKLRVNNKAKVTTTSFQCTIVNSFQIVQGNIQFKSVAGHIDKFINISNVKSKLLKYPFNICNTSASTCITELFTSRNAGINISIQYLHYTSQNDFGCQNAGLAAYSHNFDTQIEISSTCTISSGIFKHRNIYSESHIVLLVIYSYQRSYQLNAKIAISTTSCNIVKVNACGFKKSLYLFVVNQSCTIHQIVHNLDKNIL